MKNLNFKLILCAIIFSVTTPNGFSTEQDMFQILIETKTQPIVSDQQYHDMKNEIALKVQSSTYFKKNRIEVQMTSGYLATALKEFYTAIENSNTYQKAKNESVADLKYFEEEILMQMAEHFIPKEPSAPELSFIADVDIKTDPYIKMELSAVMEARINATRLRLASECETYKKEAENYKKQLNSLQKAFFEGFKQLKEFEAKKTTFFSSLRDFAKTFDGYIPNLSKNTEVFITQAIEEVWEKNKETSFITSVSLELDKQSKSGPNIDEKVIKPKQLQEELAKEKQQKLLNDQRLKQQQVSLKLSLKPSTEVAQAVRIPVQRKQKTENDSTIIPLIDPKTE